jgi:hypothetical protein
LGRMRSLSPDGQREVANTWVAGLQVQSQF